MLISLFNRGHPQLVDMRCNNLICLLRSSEKNPRSVYFPIAILTDSVIAFGDAE